jgi:hypothetical protein
MWEENGISVLGFRTDKFSTSGVGPFAPFIEIAAKLKNFPLLYTTFTHELGHRFQFSKVSRKEWQDYREIYEYSLIADLELYSIAENIGYPNPLILNRMFRNIDLLEDFANILSLYTFDSIKLILQVERDAPLPDIMRIGLINKMKFIAQLFTKYAPSGKTYIYKYYKDHILRAEVEINVDGLPIIPPGEEIDWKEFL